MTALSNTVHIDEITVPIEYQVDPLNINAKYVCIELTNYRADEKNISEVFFVSRRGNEKPKRVGWVLPILSVISSEHQYFENKFFRKHAFEIFKKYNGQEMDERMHILIYSKRLAGNVGMNVASVLINLCKYGLYPFRGNHADRENRALEKISNKMYLEEGFDLSRSTGFVYLMFSKIIQVEVNSYARFMFFYQIMELLMEVKFYSKMKGFRSRYNSLYKTREKIQEYSTERSLINAVYQDSKVDSCDATLAQVSHDFHLYRSELDHSNLKKSELIYEFRNTIVHNYYRFNFNTAVDQFADCIERDVYSILHSIFTLPDLADEKEDLISTYFNS